MNLVETAPVKKRVIKDFGKLDKPLQDQVLLQYPNGFKKSLVSFYDNSGKRVTAIPFQTEDTNYLLKVVLLPNNGKGKPQEDDLMKDEVYYDSPDSDSEYSNDISPEEDYAEEEY